MRILRVIAGLDPRDGGPVEGIKLSAVAMRERGHDTDIVSLDEPGADYLAEFPFPVHPQGKWLDRYGYSPNLVRWIARNASRFDAAIIHGLWNHASIGGWQGLRTAGLPYAMFTHGMMDPWFRRAYPLKHVAKQAFWTIWQGKVLRDAGAVLFTSEEERLLARGAFAGPGYRERVVAYGAAEPPPPSPAQQADFRALVPGLGQRRYLLFLSRLHRKKGCDLLVEAFAKFARAQPDIDLVIAGPDQAGLKAGLEALAAQAGVADRIHWPGMLTGNAKYGALRGAEAFVLPSHQENFGIAVAEAMACGIPVLVTDKVNIWREIAAAGAGLVDADTLAGVENLLARWLALMPEQREAMRRGARMGFERHFHMHAAATDLELALEAIVGERFA